MRLNEFYSIKRPLFEYDENMSDSELKDLIIKRLESEDDRIMLDKIYQILEESHLYDRIKDTLADDEDAKSKLQIFAGIIMNTDGSFADKENFIKQYPKGFINLQALTTMNQIKNFNDWLDGGEFVKKVFDNLYDYTPQGIGPGEYALAVLSPKIMSSGRKGSAAGDLIIDGTLCEVKAKKVAAGRFVDNRKSKMNQRKVETAFTKLGIEVGKGVSGKRWVDEVRPLLNIKDVKSLVDIILEGAFAYIKKSEFTPLKKALITGTFEQVKYEWGLLSFKNYKRMSDFETMLLLDSNKRTSLYFEDITNVSTLITAESPYVVGPEQQVHPKVSFRS